VRVIPNSGFRTAAFADLMGEEVKGVGFRGVIESGHDVCLCGFDFDVVDGYGKNGKGVVVGRSMENGHCVCLFGINFDAADEEKDAV
jgi:hypothetical protein